MSVIPAAITLVTSSVMDVAAAVLAVAMAILACLLVLLALVDERRFSFWSAVAVGLAGTGLSVGVADYLARSGVPGVFPLTSYIIGAALAVLFWAFAVDIALRSVNGNGPSTPSREGPR